MLESKKRANKKWGKANIDTTTLRVRKDGKNGFTMNQLRLVAKSRGLSINEFLQEAVKNEMWRIKERD